MANSGLILIPGKLAGLLAREYIRTPSLKRGNNGQNCAYYNQIYMILPNKNK